MGATSPGLARSAAVACFSRGRDAGRDDVASAPASASSPGDMLDGSVDVLSRALL